MQQLYSKDDCSPDAPSAKQWLQEQNIEPISVVCVPTDFSDTYSNICITSDLRFLKIIFSCGIHETIEELSYLEARNFILDLQKKGKEIQWNSKDNG